MHGCLCHAYSVWTLVINAIKITASLSFNESCLIEEALLIYFASFPVIIERLERASIKVLSTVHRVFTVRCALLAEEGWRS